MIEQAQLSDLKTFVILVEAGSFTKAAEKIQISRSYISKQIANLELDLGISLLHRTTRSQKLTDAGQLLYDKIRPALSTIDDALLDVVNQNDMLSGQLKINSVGGYIGEEIIAPLIAKFMSAHPQLNVELDFSSSRVDLTSGGFDFVFRMGKLEDSSLIARRLGQFKIGLYASSNYLNKYGNPQKPNDLSEHQAILGSVKDWRFKISDKKSITVKPKASLACSNGRIMVDMAKNDHGIIRVPEIYVKAPLTQNQLVELMPDTIIEPVDFYLIYLKDRHEAKRVTLFKQFVLDHLSLE